MGKDTKRFNKLHNKVIRKQVGEEFLLLKEKYTKLMRRSKILTAIACLVCLVETSAIGAYFWYVKNDVVMGFVDKVSGWFR